MSDVRATRLLALLGLGCWSLLPGCLERRDNDDSRTSEAERCALCHGDPKRPGDYLTRAVPPRDLRGATEVSSPGVGAHWVHLQASATHDAIACNQCHLVPQTVDAIGHADTARPAELVFGPLASTGGRQPTYDPVARKCADTWCHRDADAVWNEPRSSDAACGSCHGLPPPAPHPQSERCSVCHDRVVDEANHIIAPTLHLNGVVEYTAGDCSRCHGSAESAAPPLDTAGNTSRRALGVGAHRAHLAGGNHSRPLACEECHTVPKHVEDPDHVDGLPAEVQLIGIAASGARSPSWIHAEGRCANTWCHAPSEATASQVSPTWTQTTSLDCAGCHGLPPPPPHPVATECSFCHADVVGPDNRTIVARARHVDGKVDVSVGKDCTGCHGSLNPAPPFDVAGNIDTAFAGVGAHQVHVLGTRRAKAVPCETCHVVPKEVLAAGHLDGAVPAQVVFSGAAVAHGATPSYANGRCENTACHGAVLPEGHDSGGSNTAPQWTRVDGTQAACGTCHALPPPRPHPYVDQSPNCSGCHQNLAPNNMSFVRPDLHVDGVVTFTLP